ncbi:MAG: hypothetical protein JSS83_17715 [Cyanobacteria bacterium SZAS LIN-3]|nr:hypothetical protein [Cyanobacteria bacterium SZAS LIN-3]
MLKQLLGQPVQITPVILDPTEIEFIQETNSTCASEVLRPLFASAEKQGRYQNVRTQIMSFARAAEDMWVGVELSEAEYSLASTFREKTIWDQCPSTGRRRKKGLGAGEAEVLAVAISRRWTALLDDQAAVELMHCLAPNLPVVRTCALLTEAVNRNLIDCGSAEILFNKQICEELLFNCKNSATGKVLRLRCNPPRCVWEDPVQGE